MEYLDKTLAAAFHATGRMAVSGWRCRIAPGTPGNADRPRAQDYLDDR
jgi:hypothetical protein